MNRVLVCGGRDYTNSRRLEQILDQMHKANPIDELITGGARGADFLAARWGVSHEVKTCIYPAQWTKLGKKAGPMRNQRMLDEGKPNRVVAFPSTGSGTYDMIERAKKAGVELILIDFE